MVRARTALIALASLFIVVAAPRAVPTQAGGARTSFTLKGSVVDSLLKPLSGVTVSVERNGVAEAKTTTDKDGISTFAKVAPGPVRVRAELKGFDTFTRDVTLPADTASTTLAIVLMRPGANASVTPRLDAVDEVTLTTSQAGAGLAGRAGGAGGRGMGAATAVGAPPPPAATPYPAPPQQIDRYSYPYPPSGETYSQFDPNR